MVSSLLRPVQVVNLAAAHSADSQPSTGTKVTVQSTRQPTPAGEMDLSGETPTRASGLERTSSSEVKLGLRIRRFLEIHITDHGPTLNAVFAYLLIVAAATGAAATIGSIDSIKGNAVAYTAVFVTALVVGVWGNKRLR
jgi:hypothetical protein